MFFSMTGFFRRVLPAMFFLIQLSAPVLCFAEPGREAAPIPEGYFGLHAHTRGDFGRVFTETPFRVFRTWDSSVGWPLIEPEKGRWDWELLDEYAELARANGREILLTLGMTPFWAARDPEAPSPYGNCSSSPPGDIEDWKDFIRAVAGRNEREYGGVIRYWEVWNEPDNIHGGYEFYSGTARELAEMGRAAAEILKEINPENKIVSPGITQAGAGFLSEFLKAGGRDYVDIIGFHFYWDWYSPKMSDLKTVFASVNQVKIDNGLAALPLWVTEIGFALSHYDTDEERDMALVNTVLLPWYYGADVSIAYSWNNTMFTWLYSDEKKEHTRVHTAYKLLHGWMLGSVMTDLSFMHPGIRIATLERNGRRARLVWRDGSRTKFTVPADWGDEAYLMDGTTRPLLDDRTIPLGMSPVLIADEGFVLY